MEEVKVVVGRWVASPLVDDMSPLEGLQVVEKKGRVASSKDVAKVEAGRWMMPPSKVGIKISSEVE